MVEIDIDLQIILSEFIQNGLSNSSSTKTVIPETKMYVVWLSLMTLLLIIFVNFKLADELTKFRSKVKK